MRFFMCLACVVNIVGAAGSLLHGWYLFALLTCVGGSWFLWLLTREYADD